jgi:uncharacterized membrane protein YebE (DUF533 family)
MADLQRLLGGMLASGMGGRSRRGPAFAASPFLGSSRSSSFGGFRKTAGLGALAYLGYKAYQEYQKNNPGAAGVGAGGTASGGAGTGAQGRGPSLGERLGSLLGMGGAAQPQAEPEPATLDDAHAMLLIRAMIAAANADGEISPDERQRITGKLDQAGAGPDERAVLERELQNPRSADQIIREVHDQETAEEVYLASRIAMNPDTPAEKSYLDFLAARLAIPADRLDELNAAA